MKNFIIFTILFCFSSLYAENAPVYNKLYSDKKLIYALKQGKLYDRWVKIEKFPIKTCKNIFDFDKKSIDFIYHRDKKIYGTNEIYLLKLSFFKVYKCDLFESEMCMDIRGRIEKVFRGKKQKGSILETTVNFDMYENFFGCKENKIIYFYDEIYNPCADRDIIDYLNDLNTTKDYMPKVPKCDVGNYWENKHRA